MAVGVAVTVAGGCCCGCGCGHVYVYVYVYVAVGVGVGVGVAVAVAVAVSMCMCMWLWWVVWVLVCCFLFSEVKFLDMLEDELPRNHLPRMLSLITHSRGLNLGSADKTLNMKIRHGRMGMTRSGACGLI